MIEINEKLAIPETELKFEFSRSGGPGGQNVNKVSTRVTLYFDVANSPSLIDSQKQKIMTKLATRISNEGILRVVSQKYRSQKGNRDEAVIKFAELIRQALKKPKTRRKTKIPEHVKAERLEEKKHQARIKKLRSKDLDYDQ